MALELGGPQREHFRDSLVAAFPSWDDLRQFVEGSGLVKNLEAVVDRTGGLKNIVWELLRQWEAAGQVEDVLEAALAKQGNNPGLVLFAQSIGRAPQTAAHEFLTTESFDLAEQERCWRKAFAAQLQPRMIVFLLREAEQELLDPIVDRLGRHLAPDGLHPRR